MHTKKYLNQTQRTVITPKGTRGLSLVEVLVAGTLGIFVLVSVLQAFNAMRGNNRVVRSLSDLQESGWAAIRLLERDIHMAAFGGCATGETAGFNMVATNGPITSLYGEAIRGFTVNNTGNWVAGPSTVVTADPDATDPVVNSDVVTIARGSNLSATVVNDRMQNFTDAVVVEPNAELAFNRDDFVMVSDCTTADVFRVTNTPDNGAAEIALAHDSSENNSSALSKLYLRNAQVRQFVSNTYYVGETGRSDASGNPIRALYRVPHGGERVELVQGVETLQIQYGELLANGQVRYSDVTQHDIDWAKVVSVRVALLVSGEDRMLTADDANNYNLAGIVVGPAGSSANIQHPSDRKLRRVFSTTIFIQNKAATLTANT